MFKFRPDSYPYFKRKVLLYTQASAWTEEEGGLEEAVIRGDLGQYLVQWPGAETEALQGEVTENILEVSASDP